MRKAALDPGRHPVRADQDRARQVVPRDLPGDLEQGRDLGDGAPAPDGPRQLSDRLELAAQDPPRDGAPGAGAAWRAGRGRRDLCRWPQARPLRPRRSRQDDGRRRGRDRPRPGPRVPPGPAEAGRRARCLGPEPRRLPRRKRRQDPRDRWTTDGWSGYSWPRRRRLRTTEPDQPRRRLGEATPRCACRRSTWCSASPSVGCYGTHHGAVSNKHLPAYAQDEYVLPHFEEPPHRQEHQHTASPASSSMPSWKTRPTTYRRPRRCWRYLELLDEERASKWKMTLDFDS